MSIHANALLALVFTAVSGGAHAQADLTSSSIFSSGYTFEEKDGESLYRGACQGCHMSDARGATGAGTYPALAANPRLAAKQYPVALVVNGSRGMPGFGRVLSDEQVAAVVNYVRTHFSNSYPDTVAPADVKALRPKPAATGEK